MEHHGNRGLAVVTGASSGIGRALASQFASAGFDLVIAADDEQILTVASGLQAKGVQATGVKVDLSSPDGVHALHSAVRGSGRTPDAVAINAGISGDFVRENDMASELRLISLNVTGAVHLARLMLTEMIARGSGGLLLTSSIASAAPGRYYATYAASKAFLLSFAQALRHELRDTGVTVTALMPGPTETEFFDRVAMQETKHETVREDPATVAIQGVEALLAGNDHVIAGSARTKAPFAAGRVLSQSARAWVEGRQTKPQQGESD